ncbi:unnamed protein product [Candidula unifasciata]|uniref:Uncharacterized protein n=1 Tax=Candidula unifasciata TaxID=100452 RepID=A0A8S3YMJ4_9EUPU|nr:unnamed protein product [Candidula unifasciata]
MMKGLEQIVSASACVLGTKSPNSCKQVPYEVYDDARSRITWGIDEVLNNNFTSGGVTNVNLRYMTDFPYDFTRCLRMLQTFCQDVPVVNNNGTHDNSSDQDPTDSYIKETNTDLSTDVPLRNTGPAFYLLNTVDDGRGDRIWGKVGYITASGERDLKTVLWPGKSLTRRSLE